MRKKRIKKRLVHVIAICFDCGWRGEDYKTTQKEARNHAVKTGHTVNVETAYNQTYNPKEDNLTDKEIDNQGDIDDDFNERPEGIEKSGRGPMTGYF
jgi:hypothetical protein